MYVPTILFVCTYYLYDINILSNVCSSHCEAYCFSVPLKYQLINEFLPLVLPNSKPHTTLTIIK